MLRYRGRLAEAGFCEGWQWFDGSFVEDIEATQERAPRDVDVVTLVGGLGSEEDQQRLLFSFADIFAPRLAKDNYMVDAYFVDMSTASEYRIIERINYWYSMWSHRRGDAVWKGFVAVPLSSNDDEASSWLTRKAAELGAERPVGLASGEEE